MYTPDIEDWFPYNVSSILVGGGTVEINYRKCIISNRGYYFFRPSLGAGTNQERVLIKSGYYWNINEIFREIAQNALVSRNF